MPDEVMAVAILAKLNDLFNKFIKTNSDNEVTFEKESLARVLSFLNSNYSSICNDFTSITANDEKIQACSQLSWIFNKLLFISLNDHHNDFTKQIREVMNKLLPTGLHVSTKWFHELAKLQIDQLRMTLDTDFDTSLEIPSSTQEDHQTSLSSSPVIISSDNQCKNLIIFCLYNLATSIDLNPSLITSIPIQNIPNFILQIFNQNDLTCRTSCLAFLTTFFKNSEMKNLIRDSFVILSNISETYRHMSGFELSFGISVVKFVNFVMEQIKTGRIDFNHRIYTEKLIASVAKLIYFELKFKEISNLESNFGIFIEFLTTIFNFIDFDEDFCKNFKSIEHLSGVYGKILQLQQFLIILELEKAEKSGKVSKMSQTWEKIHRVLVNRIKSIEIMTENEEFEDTIEWIANAIEITQNVEFHLNLRHQLSHGSDEICQVCDDFGLSRFIDHIELNFFDDLPTLTTELITNIKSKVWTVKTTLKLMKIFTKIISNNLKDEDKIFILSVIFLPFYNSFNQCDKMNKSAEFKKIQASMTHGMENLITGLTSDELFKFKSKSFQFITQLKFNKINSTSMWLRSSFIRLIFTKEDSKIQKIFLEHFKDLLITNGDVMSGFLSLYQSLRLNNIEDGEIDELKDVLCLCDGNLVVLRTVEGRFKIFCENCKPEFPKIYGNWREMAQNGSLMAPSYSKMYKIDLKDNKNDRIDSKMAHNDANMAQHDGKMAQNYQNYSKMAKIDSTIAQKDPKMAQNDQNPSKYQQKSSNLPQNDPKMAKTDSTTTQSDSKIAQNNQFNSKMAKTGSMTALNDSKNAQNHQNLAQNCQKNLQMAKIDLTTTQNDPNMAQNHPKTVKNDQNSSKHPQKTANMAKNDSNLGQNHQNNSKYPQKLANLAQHDSKIAQNLQKTALKDQKTSKYPQRSSNLPQNDPKTAQNDQNSSKISQIDPKNNKLEHIDPSRPQKSTNSTSNHPKIHHHETTRLLAYASKYNSIIIPTDFNIKDKIQINPQQLKNQSSDFISRFIKNIPACLRHSNIFDDSEILLDLILTDNEEVLKQTKNHLESILASIPEINFVENFLDKILKLTIKYSQMSNQSEIQYQIINIIAIFGSNLRNLPINNQKVISEVETNSLKCLKLLTYFMILKESEVKSSAANLALRMLVSNGFSFQTFIGWFKKSFLEHVCRLCLAACVDGDSFIQTLNKFLKMLHITESLAFIRSNLPTILVTILPFCVTEKNQLHHIQSMLETCKISLSEAMIESSLSLYERLSTMDGSKKAILEQFMENNVKSSFRDLFRMDRSTILERICAQYCYKQSFVLEVVRELGDEGSNLTDLDKIADFMASKFLAILNYFENELKSKTSEKPLKQAIIQSLGELIRFLGQRISHLYFKIMSFLKEIAKMTEINTKVIAIDVWRILALNCNSSTLGPFLGVIFVSLEEFLDDFGEKVENICLQLVNNNVSLLSRYFPDLFFITKTRHSEIVKNSVLTQIQSHKNEFETNLELLLKHLRNENTDSGVKFYCLMFLEDLIKKNRKEFNDLIFSPNGCHPSIAKLVQLLSSGCKNAHNTKLKLQTAKCFGELGAIRPTQQRENYDKNSSILTVHSDDFAKGMLGIICKYYKDIIDMRNAQSLSLAVQGIFKERKVDKNHEIWKFLSEESRVLFKPLFSSRYTPAAHQIELNGETLFWNRAQTESNWAYLLAETISQGIENDLTKNFLRHLFPSMRENQEISLFLMPKIVLEYFKSNTTNEFDDFLHQEFSVIFKLIMTRKMFTEFSREELKSTYIADFDFEPLRKSQDSSLDKIQATIVKAAKMIFEIWDLLTRFLQSDESQHCDDAVERIKGLQERFSLIYMAEVTFKCCEYERSMLFLEKHIQQLNPNDREDALSFLIKIYAKLREPDLVDGVQWLRKTDWSLSDKIFISEVTGNLEKCPTYIEMKIREISLSQDEIENVMSYYIQANQLEQSISFSKVQLEKLYKKSAEQTYCDEIMAEPLIRLGKWDDLSDLLNDERLKVNNNQGWSISCGKLMIEFRNFNNCHFGGCDEDYYGSLGVNVDDLGSGMTNFNDFDNFGSKVGNLGFKTANLGSKASNLNNYEHLGSNVGNSSFKTANLGSKASNLNDFDNFGNQVNHPASNMTNQASKRANLNDFDSSSSNVGNPSFRSGNPAYQEANFNSKRANLNDFDNSSLKTTNQGQNSSHPASNMANQVSKRQKFNDFDNLSSRSTNQAQNTNNPATRTTSLTSKTMISNNYDNPALKIVNQAQNPGSSALKSIISNNFNNPILNIANQPSKSINPTTKAVNFSNYDHSPFNPSNIPFQPSNSTFHHELNKARLTVMDNFKIFDADHSMYNGNYNDIVHLHMLTEFEKIHEAFVTIQEKKTLENASKTLKNLISELDSRRELLQPSLSVIESTLAIRRTLLSIMKSKLQILFTKPNESRYIATEIDREIGKTWTLAAKIACKQKLFTQAQAYLQEAAPYKSHDFLIEQPKYLWKKGEHLSALKILELNCEELQNAKKTPETMKLLSRVQLKIAKNYSEIKYVDFETNKMLFKKAIIEGVENEKCHLLLADYMDRHHFALSQNHEKKDEISLPEYSKLFEIMQAYGNSMKFGSEHVLQSMSRFLQIWFDASSLSEQPNSKYRSRENISIVNDMNKYILKEIVNNIPVDHFYTAYSQLISRLCHPSSSVFKIIKIIIRKLLEKHQLKSMWFIVPGLKSKSNFRRQRTSEIFEQMMEFESVKSFITVIDRLMTFTQTKSPTDKQFMTKMHPEINRILKNSNILMPLQQNLYIGQGMSSDSTGVLIQSMDIKYDVMHSLQKPKKITFIGNDGVKYSMLLKFKDDLRIDFRFLEFVKVVNDFYRKDSDASQRSLVVRTYSVIPLNEELGIIEWIPNLNTFKNVVQEQYKKAKIRAPMTSKELSPYHDKYNASTDKVKTFDSLKKIFPPMLGQWFLNHFSSPQCYFRARQNYIKSLAIMSMIGYVMGLGDRHMENILFDSYSGEAVHVDFNCLFHKGEKLGVPERVPFRLTHSMIEAMGILGVEGPFRKCCEITLKIMQHEKNTLMSFLRPFLFDPMISKNEKEIFDSSAMNNLQCIENKLKGIVRCYQKTSEVPLSLEGNVNLIIKEATSDENLALMFFFWSPYI